MQSANTLSILKSLKVIIIGDCGVGKTSILRRLAGRKYSENYRCTLGPDFMLHDLEVDGQKVRIQVWDTVGQERFNSLASAMYRGADCCILAFDVTMSSTFKNLEMWRNEFLVYNVWAPPDGLNFPCLVVGNKIDLEDKRVVSTRRAEQWCKETGNMSYFDVSAKSAVNVTKAFQSLVRMAFQKENAARLMVDPDSIALSDHDHDRKKKKKKLLNCICS